MDDDPTEKFFTDYRDVIQVVLPDRVWVDIDWFFDERGLTDGLRY